LIKKRDKSSCGLIQDKDGQPVVAIVGDAEGGMETWNPLTSEIKLIWEKIPILAEEETFHYWSELLPINQGTGFLLYGGYKGDLSDSHSHSFIDEIWKYSVSNNTWER